MEDVMENQILASNLKRYRSAKQINQKVLSKSSGISVPTIKNLERGKSNPRNTTIQKLADALDCKFQDLFNPVGSLQNVRFRTRKSLPAREQILAHVSRWLQDYSFLEQALKDRQPYLLAYLPVGRNDGTDVRALAQEVRLRMNYDPESPIHDITRLLEQTGIKLMPYSYASDAFYSLSVGYEEGGPAIAVNTWSRISTERQIFSAAHELGHILLHTSEYCAEKAYETDEQEKQADDFAEYFLMPEESFINEWRQTSGLSLPDRVIKIKRRFAVSYKTVLQRLTHLGYADSSVFSKFKTDFEQHYGRKLTQKHVEYSEGAEPYGLLHFDFFEDRLCRLVRQAEAEGIITMRRAAEILQTDEKVLEKQYREMQSIDTCSVQESSDMQGLSSGLEHQTAPL